MEHIYKNIPGFFSFPDYYSWLAEQMPTDRPSHGVEIGVAAGQSAAYLAVELINRGAPCTLDLVDQFDRGLPPIEAALAPVKQVIGKMHACMSWDGAAFYEDKSLDFVFIDAGHDYTSVKKDIDAWLPKVKDGGIISGHDFMNEYPGIIQAVMETFDYWEVWRGKRWGIPSRKIIEDTSNEQYCVCPSWCVRLK